MKIGFLGFLALAPCLAFADFTPYACEDLREAGKPASFQFKTTLEWPESAESTVGYLYAPGVRLRLDCKVRNSDGYKEVECNQPANKGAAQVILTITDTEGKGTVAIDSLHAYLYCKAQPRPAVQ